MPVRYLSDPELARLSGWPAEVADEDAVTYFTLSADDLSLLAGFNCKENRLGVAVQLSTLPWLGWIPDDLAGCPQTALERLARSLAIDPTYHRLGPLLTPPIPRPLDGLLDVDPDLGITRLAWLRRGATAATPEALKVELGKLEFLRRHGADALDLSRLPVGRRRMLAEIGRRSTNQALQRTDVDRRYLVLLATLVATYVEVLDELVQLLDQALAGADSRARHELSQRLVDRAKAEADRARLLDEILDVLADPNVPDAKAGRLVRQRTGMQRHIAARRPAEDREQRDHGHFDLLAARYKYLRTFTPAVIAALPLTGNTASPVECSTATMAFFLPSRGTSRRYHASR